MLVVGVDGSTGDNRVEHTPQWSSQWWHKGASSCMTSLAVGSHRAIPRPTSRSKRRVTPDHVSGGFYWVSIPCTVDRDDCCWNWNCCYFAHLRSDSGRNFHIPPRH